MNRKYLLLAAVILAGIFLRFYNLAHFSMFLADQGRDAIIIKRIVTLEHLTAIGAPTSVGHIFDGPFYYYFIAPWLLLFNFDPIGLTFGVAFFSSLYLLINFKIVKELFDEKAAFISTVLLTFSMTLINFSRFSWNPNLLPLFSLLTFYSLIKGFKTRKWYYFVFFGALLSFTIQLHFLALFLIPPAGILFIYEWFKQKKKIFEPILFGIVSAVSFIIATSPLIIFDLKHGFINSKSFIALLQTPGQIATSKIDNFIASFSFLHLYSFMFQPSNILSIFLFILLCVISILFWKKNNSFPFLFIFFIFSLLGVSLYPGPKHAHYFGVVYPFFFILVGIYLTRLLKNKIGIGIVIVILASFTYVNIQKYPYMSLESQNQIAFAKTIAHFLDEKIGDKPFNFAVQPDGWQEDSYLYFLELKGKVPVDRSKSEVSQQMFVVCGDPCNLLKTKSWNITMFGAFTIQDKWDVQGVQIYKLVHVKK